MRRFSNIRYRVLFVGMFAIVATIAVACGTDRPASEPSPTTTVSTVTPAVPTPTPTPFSGNGTPGLPTPAPTNTPVITPTPTQSRIEQQLASAMARWEEKRPESYRFDLAWACFCIYSGKPTTLNVIGNKIVSATDQVTDALVSANDNGPQMTVDELFERLELALISENSTVMGVEFERDYGYPISASIDWLVGAIDDEQFFTITNFRINDQAVDFDKLRRDLDTAQFKWFENGPQNYQFVFRWECFCPPETNAPVRVEVKNGQIVSVVNIETELPVESVSGLEYRTINELFNLISERLNSDPDFVELRFDPETGQPVRARFDPILNASDDELGFYVSELTPLDVHGELKQELDAARATWASLRYTEYSFRFNWSCFCVQEFVAPVKIVVQQDSVTSVVRVEDGQPVSEQFRDDFVSVPALFDRIDDAINDGAASITATFDPQSGLPTSVFIDHNFMIADEEIGWNASELEEIK